MSRHPSRLHAALSSVARLVVALLIALPGAARATESMRLPNTVQPRAVTLVITLDPAQPRHHGEVQIDVALRQRVSSLLLHARALRIESAWIESGAQRIAARARMHDAQRIELRFARAVPAGPARLTLRFSGLTSDKDAEGLFRRRVDGRWQAYTQFESNAARAAFPLFDEPGWKLPWTLSLIVPESALALANTPPRHEAPAGAGFKRIDFETTAPLPSYLLGFAVGDFDLLDAGAAGPVPMRIVVPRGRAGEARFAAQHTGAIVERLEAYFGLPYPFTKLDSLAVALPDDFGAMEHPGLVTYAEALLLATAVAETPRFRRNYTGLAAHELAHQWFGNLVTMAWWDDLWLNESFANWMGDRIGAEVMPGAGFELGSARARLVAMRADRLPSARRVQQPIDSEDQLASVWNAITYAKGQSVLAMFEQWLGEERFRNGVRRYLQRHAWGSARTDDFLAALGEEDAALPAALRSFVSQAGIPRVDVELLCDAVKPRLRLRQSALQPLGTPARVQRWQLPLRIRTPGGLTRLMLTDAEATVELPDTDCPPWVQANDGGSGYYRAAYTEALRGRLAAEALPTAEHLAALDDALGLAESGDLPLSALWASAEAAAADPHLELVQLAIEVMTAAQAVAPAPQQAGLPERWQRAFAARAAALGWDARAGDSDDDRLLRATLLPALALHGGDTALRAEALRRVQAWLGPEAAPLEPGMRRALLTSAALDGDAELFDALQRRLAAKPALREREDLWAALGSFRSPALARRARGLLLDPALDAGVGLHPLMRAQNGNQATRDLLLEFVRLHHAALVRRLPGDQPAFLPNYVDNGCSADSERRIAAVFGRHAGRFAGGRLALRQTLERVHLCAAWRAAAAQADTRPDRR